MKDPAAPRDTLRAPRVPAAGPFQDEKGPYLLTPRKLGMSLRSGPGRLTP
jgi:hypothetical protein